jgi:hypothetical protein
VAKKDIPSKTVALTAIIFGPMALLFLGSVYNILSDREWATEGEENSCIELVPAMAIDDDARRRILRGIWIDKISIGVLLVVLRPASPTA